MPPVPLPASHMLTPHLQQLSRLRGFLEVTRLVRSEDELDDLLAAIARAISTSLRYATVVVHLHRPAWDDFVVTTVHGGEAAREQLMGDARPARPGRLSRPPPARGAGPPGSSWGAPPAPPRCGNRSWTSASRTRART